MIKEKVSRLPVLQDNKLAGMIRLSDLFKRSPIWFWAMTTGSSTSV